MDLVQALVRVAEVRARRAGDRVASSEVRVARVASDRGGFASKQAFLLLDDDGLRGRGRGRGGDGRGILLEEWHGQRGVGVAAKVCVSVDADSEMR